jgi:hypothetical protein
MPRHKDQNWCLPEGRPTERGTMEHQWTSIHAALLMDIRDEFKKLNALLHCSNFLRIPQKLDEIRRNTTKKKRKAND